MSEMIKTMGGPHTPQELASAYNEQRDLIAELTREKQRLEVSAERYEALAHALRPIVEDSVSGSLRRNSDFDELSAKVDDMVDAMRRASDAFSDI